MSATFLFTASPAYVAQAMAELRALDRGLTGTRSLAPGVICFTTGFSRAEFLSKVQAQEPIFVRHIQPVDRVAQLTGGTGSLEAIASACAGLLQGDGGDGSAGPTGDWSPPLLAGAALAVQIRRFGAEGEYTRTQMLERLEPVIRSTGAKVAPQGGDVILSIVLEAELAHIGLSTAVENLSDWAGGEVRFRREEDQQSRAKFKLLEAFQRFQPTVPPGGRALDLGAAPGGWTSLLLERGLRVTAVDTGEVAGALQRNPGLTFVRKNVDDVEFPPDAFDVMTCDMSWNPLHTARALVRLAPSLRRGGHAILTVKLLLQNPTRTIRQVAEAVVPAFDLRKTKQLFHNRDEVTMHLVRK